MVHECIKSAFVSSFLDYNLSKDGTQGLEDFFPEISDLGNDPKLVNGLVRGRLRECGDCKRSYVTAVRTLCVLT